MILVENGLENVKRHIETLKNTFKVNVVVTINKFLTDTDEEIAQVINSLKEFGVDAVVNECFAKGGSGTLELADAVLLVGFGGQNVSQAVANILVGKVNPSGRLTETYAYSVADIPSEPFRIPLPVRSL